MKKFIVGMTSVLVCCSLALAACGGNDDNGDNNNNNGGEETAYSLSLNTGSLELEMTHGAYLTATLFAGDKTVDGEITWSSSNTDVVTVANGTVTAVQSGTATVTASSNGASASCAVTVSASYLPSVQLGVGDAATLAVLLDGEYTLQPYVVYDGNRFDDGSFTYSVADSNIVSVTESGSLTGVSLGNTTVTVQGSWRGFGAETLSAAYGVRVADDFTVTINPLASNVIAASDAMNNPLFASDNYTVPNTVQLSATVKNKGNAVNDAALTWYASEESVATVDPASGLVTGRGVGKVTVGANFVSGGLTYAAVPVTLDVELPVFDRTSTIQLGYEENKELDASDMYDNNSDGLALNGAFGTDNKTLTGVVEIGAGNTRTPYRVTENGLVKENNSGTVSLAAGEHTWEVQNAEYGYQIKVKFVTRIINDADDLMKCFEIVTTGSNNQQLYGNGALYVLGGNIDASGTTRAQDSWTNNFTSAGGSGFQGTFDGRGYSIDGLTVQMGGLFGNLAPGSVIKNFALTNLTLATARNDYQPAPLANAIYGDARIENVFIHVTKATAPAPSANDKGIRGLTHMLYGIKSSTYPTFKDVVVFMDVGDVDAAKGAASLSTKYHTGNYAHFDNVHIISDYKFVRQGGDNPVSDGASPVAVPLDGTITRYGAGATNATFAAAHADDTLVGLDSSIWVYDASIGYPVFQSYNNVFRKAAVQKAFDALQDISLDAGESYTLPMACEGVTLSADSQDTAITTNGRVLTIGEDTAGGTFTLTVTSSTYSDISEQITVTVRSKQQIAEANTKALFEKLNGKTFEFEPNKAGEWSVANADISEATTEDFGTVTYSVTGGAGVSVGENEVVIADTAPTGSWTVTVTNSTYGTDIKATVTIRLLEVQTVTTEVKLSKDADDELLTVDYTGVESAGTQTGISASYKPVGAESFTAIEEDNVSFTTAGKAVLTADAVGALKAGINQVVIRVQISDKVLEFTNVIVYTDVITTWDEFDNAFIGATANQPTYGADTYYILGNNIDANGAEKGKNVSTYFSTKDIDLSKGLGFLGTFDGKGYTINNVVTKRGGLFGHIGTNAVIKNVAITNLKFSSASAANGQEREALFYEVWGAAVVENLFVHVADISGTPSGQNAFLFAVTLRTMSSAGGNNDLKVTLKNVVFVMEGTRTADSGKVTTSLCNLRSASGNSMITENVNVISDYKLYNHGDTVQNTSDAAGATRHNAGATFKAELSDSGYSETYWENNDNFNYTVFKSAVKFLLPDND